MTEKTKTDEAAKNEAIAVLERKLEGHTHWVKSVAVSPDGKLIASGSWDKTVKIWDMESGKCRTTLKGHKDSVECVAFTPDGKRLLSGSWDDTIRIWDVQSGRQLAKLTGHDNMVFSVAALPDNKRALSGAIDFNLKLWDMESGKCLKTLEGHKDSVKAVAVTGDGKQAVSASDDKTIKVWDIESGQCLKTLTGHSNEILSVQVTPDGRIAVSGSEDKTVKVWDLQKGICTATFEGHQKKIYSVAISPDGRLAASTGFTDSTLRIWDLLTGACLQVIRDEENFFAPVSVTFSPDGSRLIVGNANTGTDYSIYIYRLSRVEASAKAVVEERYTNAKVVLVGESGVGKSGLAHRLIEDKFVKTSSTHGMKVWRLDLPMEEQEGMEREALLWDLAGQEDYRLIHQLFFEETALALVLFNPQKDDPFSEVVDWLKALETACGEKVNRVAKLLIAARCDVGSIKVSQKKIEQFLEAHGFVGYLSTSALSGKNCSDSLNKNQPSALKKMIAGSITWDNLPWTSTPGLLRELKNTIMAMKTADTPKRRRQGKAALLRFSELAGHIEQILPDEDFTESDVRTAVTLLGNHGLVQTLEFGDLVLLKPELLNSYAGAVIRAARSHTDEIGCAAEADVFDRKIDFTGVERLAKADEELLLRAMVQTFLDKSLCIAEETPIGKQLIFPSQYRRERPIPAHPNIFVSYTFCGELATVYTTLVVRLWYSSEFENKELWNNAAEFTTTKGKIAGITMKRSGEGEGTISVFFDTHVPDELKVVFIKYMHDHLLKYAVEVRRDRRYVCARCGKPVIDLEAVQRRLQANKGFIYCQNCDEKITLIDHIEKRLKSDPVARKVFAMDKIADQKLDSQALEQILNGHMLAICGEANQVFRLVLMDDYGIDGEVEFRDDTGKPCGKKIYVQLKSGVSHLRHRKRDDQMIFDVKKEWHLDYWVKQPVDVYLVIRDGEGVIRWMNATQYLNTREDKKSKQIVFSGEKLDAAAVLRLREQVLGSR